MQGKEKSNIVIIIGGDHHNGLNLARSLGVNNVVVYALIICNDGKSFIASSKYIKKAYYFANEDSALDYLKTIEFSNKPIIFPYSDTAAYALDMRLNEFKSSFLIPSICEKQGAIASLMDKNNQINFANISEIKVANSTIISMKNEISLSIEFPVILKPVISAKGDKKDIRVCFSKNEFDAAIICFREKSYESILCQEYLDYDYEAVIVGAIYKTSKESDYVVHKILRRWPEKGGTNSFSIEVIDDEIRCKCGLILEKIKLIGFYGLIDVEVFIKSGNVYLNEINWRNSGGGFRSLRNDFYYAYWLYLDMQGKDFSNNWNRKCVYSIVEHSDIRYVFSRKITLFHWIKDFQKAKNRALYYRKDIKPMIKKWFYHFF